MSQKRLLTIREAAKALSVSIRTTFATMLCRSGVPAAVARVLLRHSDVRLTLEIYTDLVPKDAAEGIAKLHVVPPGVPSLVPKTHKLALPRALVDPCL